MDSLMPKDRFFNLTMIKNSLTPIERDFSEGDEEEGNLIGESDTPLLDIYEESGAVVIEADLPGIRPDNVSVRLSNNQVIIEGRRGGRGEEQNAGDYLRMERCIEDFRRIIPLPIAVDPQRAEAVYRQGVLILRFPRIEDRRNRAIQIEIK